MFDLSFLAQEPIVSITGSSVVTATINFLGYYYGERLQFNKMKQELIMEKLNDPKSIIPAVDIARCKNIKEIAQIADSLDDSSQTSPVEFSSEWFTRFFDSASLVSDRDMQTIWAKILNSETEEKGRYSFRFIESMRLLSKVEAEIFLKISKLAVQTPLGGIHIISPENEEMLEIYRQYDIDEEELLLLEECGLINMGVEATHELELERDLSGFFNDQYFVNFSINPESKIETFEFHSYSLTRFGSQLYELIEETTSADFILDLARTLKSQLDGEIIVSVHNYTLEEEIDGRVSMLLDANSVDISNKNES